MRPVIEGLIPYCSTAQTNRSNGRVLGLEGCTIGDGHKGYRCHLLMLLPLLPLLVLAWIHVRYVKYLSWMTGTIRPRRALFGSLLAGHSSEAFLGKQSRSR
jgi:hypothetical protein